MANRILIVEENEQLALNLSMQMEKNGYELCGVASDYKEAIGLISKYNPDLIILDVILGGKPEGIEIANHIRQGSKKPFIYHSSPINQELFLKMKDTEPFTFLEKPIELSKLVRMINRVFNSDSPSIRLSKFNMIKDMFPHYPSFSI